MFIRFFLMLLCHLFCLQAKDRRPIYPYISGDTFRDACDFVVDETNHTLKCHLVKHGDTIFVKTDFLIDFFKKYHPKIAYPYVLVTHNSDSSAPGVHVRMLKDPKILAWFGQNIEGYTHPKLHPIPIGFANRYCSHDQIECLEELRMHSFAKEHLLYMNFSKSTAFKERSEVFDYFIGKSFCFVMNSIPFESYLHNLGSSKFVLSPRGHGLDCHRTWEALWMGSYPIIISSASDEMYEDLPVLIIKEWKEVTKKFLEQKYVEMATKNYNLDKLFFPYWENLINSFKE